MLKRIFWLALLVFGGWVLWSLWRRQQDTYHTPSPQFAPIVPASSTAPAASATPVAAPVSTPKPATRSDTNGVDAPADPPTESDVGDSAPAHADDPEPIIGYCTRCQEKREISDAQEELTESGRRAARGTCPVCGGNMYTFLKKKPDGE